MANEIVHDSDAALTAALERVMVEEARAGIRILDFFDVKDISNEPTLAVKTVKHPSTANAGAITDGTALANTGMNPTSVSQTTSGVGLKGVITDFSTKGSLLTFEEAAANFGRALSNKIDVDTCALLSGFSATAGTSGADATIGNILTLLFNLENAVEDGGPIVGALAPIHLFDLRSAIVASAASVWTGRPEALKGFLDMSGVPLAGELFGVPIVKAPNAPTANAGADKAGAFFRAKRALKMAWKWAPKLERRREPDMVGDMLVVHACYNAAEVVDGAGTSLITGVS